MNSHAAINNPAVQEIGKAFERSSARSKWLLLLTIVVCYGLAWWLAGRVGVAAAYGFDGSLLLSPRVLGNVVIAGVVVLAAVGIGTVLAGTVRPDAGLFAAAVGLIALSNQGRPIVAVLHDADGRRSVFLLMALELLVLYVLLGVGAWMLHTLQRKGRLAPDGVRDGLADVEQPPGAGWTAMLTHAAIMAAALILIAQAEDKKQVLAAVGIASFCGAFFPYWHRGAHPSVWYWTAPLAVGVAGYLLAFFTIPQEALALGRPGYHTGFLAGLARPLPLDYAGAGTVGALLGYWMRRQSVREREVAIITPARPSGA